MCFFLFKQKTAYEMRISDWSSDVCSSDLLADRTETGVAGIRAVLAIARHAHHDQTWIDRAQRVPAQAPAFERAGPEVLDDDVGLSDQFKQQRSEEHTSELQSLMRISYDVYCLKKKSKHYNKDTTCILTTDQKINS